MPMNREDAYYEPEDDDIDSLQEEIFELVSKDKDYDPSDLSNWSEALSQNSDNQDFQDFVKDCVTAKDWAKLGLKLYQISWDYQEISAEYYLTR